MEVVGIGRYPLASPTEIEFWSPLCRNIPDAFNSKLRSASAIGKSPDIALAACIELNSNCVHVSLPYHGDNFALTIAGLQHTADGQIW